ncbi:MAG: glycoside hydrolase family 25 protein [Bosea sp. (in: a-proteobacteria)]
MSFAHLPKFSRLLIGGALLTALAGCVVDYSGRYSQKGDVRPHPGVATAMNYPIHGIDVARYQTEIDWADVKASGTRFAFIKATEGGDYIDPMFARNWAAAKRAGVPRGAYHFVFWCRPAHEQAQWFRQHIPNDPDALPPVLDLEWNGHSRTCPHKINKQLALEKIQLMLVELEQTTGKKPVIYTDITFHKDILEGQFNGYAYWLRSTAAKPETRYNNRPWAFWQYTTTGRVPGIRGDVDRNAFYGTEEEFEGWRQGRFDIGTRTWNNRARPQPAPAPVQTQPLPAPVAAAPAQVQPVGAPGQPQPDEGPEPVE